jgi:uncharacterized protein (DUF849 family)
MLIKVAINGSRTPEEHPSIPVTPQQQAVESAAAIAAGAGAIHVHVRGTDGRENLSPDDSARALEAIRAACPGVPAVVEEALGRLCPSSCSHRGKAAFALDPQRA